MHTEERLLLVDGNGMSVNVSCDAIILVHTVEALGNGEINLPNLSLSVERAHGLNLLTCAPSPHRSMQTSGQTRSGFETLRYRT